MILCQTVDFVHQKLKSKLLHFLNNTILLLNHDYQKLLKSECFHDGKTL